MCFTLLTAHGNYANCPHSYHTLKRTVCKCSAARVRDFGGSERRPDAVQPCAQHCTSYLSFSCFNFFGNIQMRSNFSSVSVAGC